MSLISTLEDSVLPRNINNPYWISSCLVKENYFRQEIFRYLSALKTYEKNEIQKIMLFGSLVDIQDKFKLRHLPNDVDVFIKIENNSPDLEEKVKECFPNTSSVLQLPYHIQVTHREFDEIDEFSLASTYRLFSRGHY